MPANRHLQPELFDPGPRLSAHEQDAREHARMGRQVATFGEVAVSTPRNVVPRIQMDGGIRTQHETARSQGAFNPPLRRQVESEMGYDEAPVYGYFRRSPTEEPPYGNVDFHLKSSVKDRTYMHPGDSLNNFQAAEFTGIEGPETASTREVIEGSVPAPRPGGEDESTYEDVDYVEAHILPDARPETLGLAGSNYASRVPLEDVRKVSIHESGMRFDPTGEFRDHARKINFQVGRDLSQAGIPVEHVLTDLTEQRPLPLDFHGDPGPPSIFGTRKRVVRHEDMQGRDRWGSD